jgi:hypothetical protein
VDDKQKLAVFAHASDSLFKHLSQFSLTIIDTKDHDDPASGKWEIFSGTLLEVGDRLLVATASHCVKLATAPTRYWILGDHPCFKSDGVPSVVAAWNTPGDSPDVGILELDRSNWQRFSSKSPCSLARVRIVRTGRSNRSVSLIGSPGQCVEVETRDNAKGLKAVVISYSTLPLEQSEWSKVVINSPADGTVDIILDYPAGSDHTIRLDTGVPIELPNPKGMSGGGLWDQGFGIKGPDTIWSHDDAFLFGIQSAWHATRRYVCAVQIIHWLRLVHQYYPQLRSVLEQQFPELKS